MSFSKISALAGFVALASKVSAHGTVTGIVADGTYYVGYSANYQYMATQPVVVGWSTPEDTDNGFVSDYTSSDIICHKGATNAQTSATVKAGGTVELQWTTWPESHHGPVIDYLADCGGDCTTVDKTTLEFFKIDGVGLVDDTTIPGDWASDTLIANNNSWSVTIPSTIAPGNYVLRHEIIALHSAGTEGGAQNYPQCFNLEVTGSGTDAPTGTLGTSLYTATDPGILVNIYAAIASYVVPGPALYSGAVSASQGVVSATAVASSAVATSAATGVVTSSPAVVTSAPASAIPTTAPYSNSTLAAVSSKTRKSACKAKTSSAALGNASSLPAAVNVPGTSSLLTTSAESVTIPTSLPTSVESYESTPTQTSSGSTGSGSGTSSGSSPSTSGTSSSTSAPEGTTLNDLLSWISSFYNKYTGKTYTEASVARRHARDLAARQMDSFTETGSFSKPTGTFPSGAAHPSHFSQQHRPQGTGFAHASGHHHHHHGHAKPTGSFSAGAAFPTGKGAFFKHAGF
ncbi:hypothetical protein IFR04_006612 [Cadophora malorum]|uniref:Auxiliary Activity family 9 catalytic domain-containing protein n=1 Tax=Cadophora malorum TaxID=108018 RepID=A0A8H7TIC7_9HELO|nr:hypothetical protein IFR04_006612 [Cadophora malorum]